jgi:hypothetical protein
MPREKGVADGEGSSPPGPPKAHCSDAGEE